MPPKRQFVSCEICGLQSSRKNCVKRLFMAKFPLDEDRCRQWVKAVGKEDLIYVPIEKLHSLKYVCGNHFERKAFNKKKNRLKKFAIPTLHLKAVLPDEMLLEFPCHIHSTNRVSQRISDTKASQSMIEAIAGPSTSESCMPGKLAQKTSDQLHNQDISHEVSLSQMEAIAGPSTTESCIPGQQSSAQKTSDQLHKQDISHEVSLSQLEPITGPSISESCMPLPGQQSSAQKLSDQLHKQDVSHEVSHSQMEAIAGPSTAELYIPDQIMASDQKLLHSRKRKRRLSSGPSTSTTRQMHLHDHTYYSKDEKVNQSPKRRKLTRPDLEVTPRKRKMIRKINLCKRKINVLREGNIMPRIKSLALKTLIKAYIRNHDRKPGGKRWTSLEKALAIAIYKKSPRTYRHLQHLMALPSIRTMQTLLQSIDLEPGISKNILDHLKKKAATMNEKDRLCALLFDEIALKRRLIFNPRTDKVEGFVDLGETQYRSSDIANHALVFMIQGLHKKMKQPIAYYFVKGTISSQSLATLIKDVISAVTDIGFSVITTVCDQGPTNVGCINLLKTQCGIPQTSNYFLLNEKKIFVMFDIPHLFKSIRNNFHNGGEIVINEKKGKWCHLLDAVEKNRSTLHFKKLTPLHVNPTFRTKMKVKLAAQVLSNTVAAILKLMAEKYGNEQKAKEILQTAEIIEDLDRLFDCTNGPSSRKDVIKHRRENVSTKTNHVELWRRYKIMMRSMYFLKSDSFLRLKNVRCVQGYVTSLSSLEDIWKHVEAKGYKYLNLRQLNQDSLENLFGMIRQHCPTNRNPTCHHFTAALKSNILTKLSTPVGRGTNCEKDDNVAIIDFEDFISQVEITEAAGKESLGIQIPVIKSCEDTELPVLHLTESADLQDIEGEFGDEGEAFLKIEQKIFENFEKQPTVYVAGYLAAVILKKIKWKCNSCKLSLIVEDPHSCNSKIYSYIRLREWWQDKRSLKYPSLSLCEFIDQMTSCFESYVKPILYQKHISHQAVTMMLAKCDGLMWICNDHKDKLLHLLLLRLSHLLIRNECQRQNLCFSKAEEAISINIKKAELQGFGK